LFSKSGIPRTAAIQEDDVYYTGMGDKGNERTERVVSHWGCLWGLSV